MLDSVNPNGGASSIRWQGEIQSLSQMLHVLEKDHGAKGLYGVHRNFRIVEHEKSLREEAESIDPGEEIAEQEDEPKDQPPDSPPLPPKERKKKSHVQKIALAAIKAFFVMVATTLGAKFGGWLGAAIAAAIAGAFAVVIGPDVGTSEQSA